MMLSFDKSCVQIESADWSTKYNIANAKITASPAYLCTKLNFFQIEKS